MSSTETNDDDEMISEYTRAYCWKENPEFRYTKPKPDEYETLVKSKMDDDYQSSTSSKTNEITDPYEILVQQKMTGEYQSKSSSDIVDKPLDEKTAEQPSQDDFVQEDSEIKYDALSQEQEKPEEKQAPQKQTQQQQQETQKRSYQQQQQQEKAQPQRTYRNTAKAKATNKFPVNNRRSEEVSQSQPKREKKGKSTNFLSSSVNNTIKPRVTVYKPQFFSHPEAAPPEEQPNLHGPFWVYWPKDEVIPAKYGGLRNLIRKR